MGLSPFSNSSYDNTTTKNINPNPFNFKLKRGTKRGNYLIAEINYPDCKNFEGNKILVFENLEMWQLQEFKSIDPHFSNNKDFKSPIARFEPTEKGWQLALGLTK